MNDQVLLIEQMQELEELGIDISKASMCWIGCTDGNDVYPYTKTFKKCFEKHLNTIPVVITPTFTLQDILTLLPKYIVVNNHEYKWNIMPFHTQYVIQYLDTDCVNPPHITFVEDTLLEASFNMFKWCKQHNKI